MKTETYVGLEDPETWEEILRSDYKHSGGYITVYKKNALFYVDAHPGYDDAPDEFFTDDEQDVIDAIRKHALGGNPEVFSCAGYNCCGHCWFASAEERDLALGALT